MMRQVALGAVVAFALTVLALSVFTPSADPAPAPVITTIPAPAPAPVPAPTQVPAADQTGTAPTLRTAVPARPLMLRPNNVIRPEMLQPRQLKTELVPVDAGTP